MARKTRYLTATMADGYVKTIGPTASPFTHYWRIVADLGKGKTEVFWGHAKSLKDATGKKEAAADAARQRGWAGFVFEVVALVESTEPPDDEFSDRQRRGRKR
ncbi:hypothetical protein [Sphingomonas paucimobilis]|uniref:hypothetical protein n=1 Tax=Sphingomonas paucimobilis TaxID=13689 RepID=UPI0028D4591F|nr:hypothetical protein [Sphingomonas paucimobilis]